MSPFFLFDDTPTPEIYTLSLHDALPISFATGVLPNIYEFHLYTRNSTHLSWIQAMQSQRQFWSRGEIRDRKSTRLNSSHVEISYAVFCLKKKTSAKSCESERHKGR